MVRSRRNQALQAAVAWPACLPVAAEHAVSAHARTAYQPHIDGLRAIAVLSVVGFHAFPDWIKGGFIGVDIFFVISGFLISSIIVGDLERDGFSYAHFYLRRIKRIFPALALVLLASLALGWFLLVARDYAMLGKHVASGAAFSANIVFFGESGYFNNASESKPLLHLWSLGVEEQFYIVWPLLLALAWKRKVDCLALTFWLAAASFLINVYLINIDPPAAFFLPLSRFWEILAGAFLAMLLARLPHLAEKLANVRATAGLALIAMGLLMLDGSAAFPGWWALLPALGTFLLISAGPGAWINRKLLGNGIMVKAGLISYPLYLWHWPLLSFAMIAHNYDSPSGAVRLGIVVVSIGLAWLTYLLIEKSVRVYNKVPPKVLGLLMAGLFSLGLSLTWSSGLEGRPVNRDEKSLFLNRYHSIHDDILAAYYHDECDFYDWPTGRNKGSISPACTRPGAAKTFLLWGDSHAQALSHGLRQILPPSIGLAQITTSGCKPELVTRPDNGSNRQACRDSNAYALKKIAELKPDVVIVTQVARHERTDWDKVADALHASGAGQLIVVGPTPQWRPSLPIKAVRHNMLHEEFSLLDGLDESVLATDQLLRKSYQGSKKLTYVSLIEQLCSDAGCQATVPSADAYKLIAWDYGHLTPAGSEFIARRILLGHLPPR